MSIETDLYATLTAGGSNTGAITSRIHLGVANQRIEAPYVRANVLAGTKIDTLSGVDDADRKVIQIACYDQLYSGAKALAAAVEADLAGNGYLAFSTDGFEEDTKLHVVYLDWPFIQ